MCLLLLFIGLLVNWRRHTQQHLTELAYRVVAEPWPIWSRQPRTVTITPRRIAIITYAQQRRDWHASSSGLAHSWEHMGWAGPGADGLQQHLRRAATSISVNQKDNNDIVPLAGPVLNGLRAAAAVETFEVERAENPMGETLLSVSDRTRETAGGAADVPDVDDEVEPLGVGAKSYFVAARGALGARFVQDPTKGDSGAICIGAVDPDGDAATRGIVAGMVLRGVGGIDVGGMPFNDVMLAAKAAKKAGKATEDEMWELNLAPPWDLEEEEYQYWAGVLQSMGLDMDPETAQRRKGRHDTSGTPVEAERFEVERADSQDEPMTARKRDLVAQQQLVEEELHLQRSDRDLSALPRRSWHKPLLTWCALWAICVAFVLWILLASPTNPQGPWRLGLTTRGTSLCCGAVPLSLLIIETWSLIRDDPDTDSSALTCNSSTSRGPVGEWGGVTKGVLVLLMMWATPLMPTGIGGELIALVVAVLVMVAYCGRTWQEWS
eukprot:COSAG06_NODE_239_length_19404_cov_12.723284_26_plen_493_part_00